ncbi:MAG: VWA domain-containing protein, partial [Roseiflexaceae bacterium]|nr:VWA domain-containing protein [Roseiflexaceae bacterium]
MNTDITLTAACEHPLVAVEVSSQRTVEWTVSAPDARPQSARAPLNLALVLDRSGSMGGEKLRYVKQAAAHVLDQLDERDRVALVAYDDTVQLLAASAHVTAQARSQLSAAIEGLRPGGSTDLSG